MDRSVKAQSGYLLILTIIEMTVFLLVLAALAQSSLSNFASSRADEYGYLAIDAAEAGADNAVFHINQDNTYTGTNTSCPITGTGSNPVTLYNDSRGKATFETCISGGSISNEKIVYATGRVYLPGKTIAFKSRTVRLVIEGTASSSYAVESGPGGLIMSNSANVINGPVYVSGKLTMSNTAAIGTAAAPLAVSVGNYSCPQPADNTYPVLCTNGTQPISISNQAHIYGSTSANGQTTTTGLSNPGLVASSGVSYQALPDYDRAAQKAAVTSTMTHTAASCSGNGSVTWAANLHITGGDVSLSNNCVVTINGNVWIDGGLSLSNKAIIKVATGLNTAPVIMVDGSSGVSLGNQSSISSNAGGIGAEVITFWSKANCSPDCGNVTGTDLASSQTVTTIDLGNQGLGAGSSFYARWTELTVGNSGSVGSILGQTIKLNNTGNITFGGGVVAGSALTYAVRYYQQL